MVRICMFLNIFYFLNNFRQFTDVYINALDVYTDVNTDVYTDVNTDMYTDVNTDVNTDVYTDVNTRCEHRCVHMRPDV